VPKDIAEKGYTPYAVAQRIAAEISTLQRAARITGRLEVGFELSATQIDFTVPSAGISYRTIIRYVRQLLGKPEHRVQGEIVREPDAARIIESSESVPYTGAIRIVMRTLVEGYTTRLSARDSMKEQRAIFTKSISLSDKAGSSFSPLTSNASTQQ
jgi:hypothetical protein